MRARFMQLLRLQHFDPALRVEGEWTEAARAIARHWQAETERTRPSLADSSGIERMIALENERRSLPHESVRSHVRHLFGRRRKRDAQQDQAQSRPRVCEQQVEAYFDALRLPSAERERIREGFRTMGTGGMHRALPVLLTSLVYGLAGGALMADSGTLKAGLHLARMTVQLALAGSIFYSGRDRFRTSALEDVLTQGRADAAPLLKEAPDVMRASWDAIRRMPDLGRAARKLERAVARLNVAGAGSDTQALRDVRRCFARVCHLMSVADDYKRAADNAAGEFKGNERTLMVSWSSSLMYLIGAGLSILAPMKIDAAGVGGAMTASAALGLLAFVAAQTAGGADQDGLDKGERAIANLVRHLLQDVRRDHGLDAWASAYANYLASRPGRFAAAGRQRQAALRSLDEALEQLGARHQEAEASPAPPAFAAAAAAPRRPATAVDDPELEQLLRFTIHACEQLEKAEGRPAGAGSPGAIRPASAASVSTAPEPDGSERALAQLLLQSWKTPAGLRLEAIDRLTTGTVAKTMDRLFRARARSGLQGMSRPRARRRRVAALRATLKGALEDCYHLESARRELGSGAHGNPPDADAAERAALHLARIGNKHVRRIFTGNTREQLRAMAKSRTLTAGESLRYTMTNLGANLMPVLVTTGLGAGDLAVTLQRAAGTYAGPQYLDFKMGAVASTGVQPGAYLSAGARASFRKRDMAAVHEALRPQQPLHVRAPLPNGLSAWSDDLVALLEQQARVPDSIHWPGDGQDDIEVRLTGTAGHLSSLYRTASRQQKRAARKAYMEMGMRQLGVGTVAVMMQPFAARSMKKSRRARQHVPALLARAREAMDRRRNAGTGAA